MAITLRGDLPAKVVFHTDRGTQYASAQITAFAAANGLTRSMGYTGICWDNAMAESFFATLKTEFYYRRVWPTKKAARVAVGAWIEDRYNRRRRHSSIGQISPVAFELQYSRQIADSQKACITRVHETGQGQCSFLTLQPGSRLGCSCGGSS
jgi:putative transposase